MNNHIKVEEIEEDKLPTQKTKKLTPKKEHSELSQKKIKKINLSDKLSHSQIIPTKSIVLDSSKEKKANPTEKKIYSTKQYAINSDKNPKIPAKNKNNKIKEIKEEDDHISLNELSDDENAENPIIIKSKRSHKGQSNKEIKPFKYIGKKRKNPEKGKVRIKPVFQKKNNGNNAEDKKKKKLPNLNEDKNLINLIDENNSDNKRRNNIAEKKILINLVKKEGFRKIFEYLSIFPLNRKNPIERQLDDIILNLGLLRTTILLFLVQMEQNNSTNINLKKLIPLKNIMSLSKNNNRIRKIDSTNNWDKDDDIVNIDISDDEIEEIKKPNIKKDYDYKKRINSAPKSSKTQEIKIGNNKDIKDIPKKKNNISSSKIVSIKKEALNKELEISVHLQKDKDGKIYKYTKRHLCSNKGGEPFYTFYCADRKCGAKAYYYIRSMKFENIKNHKFTHCEHCYIRNMNRNMNVEDKYNPIVTEFLKRNYHEAQIFLKNDGTQLVKWYDQI